MEEQFLKKVSGKKNRNVDFPQTYGAIFNLGFYLATPIVVGVFAGLALDNWLRTKPFFIIIFIIIGSISSFYNLIKLTKEKDATH